MTGAGVQPAPNTYRGSAVILSVVEKPDVDYGAKSVVLLAALEIHGFPPTARLIRNGIEPWALAS
jgi:hypothetical protein